MKNQFCYVSVYNKRSYCLKMQSARNHKWCIQGQERISNISQDIKMNLKKKNFAYLTSVLYENTTEYHTGPYKRTS